MLVLRVLFERERKIKLAGLDQCVADALLDETEVGSDQFMHYLIELGKQKSRPFKLLTTSRKSPHIAAVLENPSCLEISLERRLVDQDIISYVDRRLRLHEGSKLSDENQKGIKETISAKAGGLFLYARLILDQLLPMLELKPIEVLLEDLPSSLEEMSTSLLREHSKRSRVSCELQILILQLVTHASHFAYWISQK